MKTISSDTQRLVCYLFMRNYTDREVCKQLKIEPEQLNAIKLKLELAMKKAGIRNGGSEQFAVRSRA